MLRIRRYGEAVIGDFDPDGFLPPKSFAAGSESEGYCVKIRQGFRAYVMLRVNSDGFQRNGTK